MRVTASLDGRLVLRGSCRFGQVARRPRADPAQAPGLHPVRRFGQQGHAPIDELDGRAWIVAPQLAFHCGSVDGTAELCPDDMPDQLQAPLDAVVRLIERPGAHHERQAVAEPIRFGAGSDRGPRERLIEHPASPRPLPDEVLEGDPAGPDVVAVGHVDADLLGRAEPLRGDLGRPSGVAGEVERASARFT